MPAYLLILFLAFFLTGCAPEPNSQAAADGSANHPLNVVATVGMVADIVENVGGPHVEVTQLLGAGVDPHLYKPTRDDVQAMMSSDAIFYAGLMLEGKMADSLVKVARNKPVFAVTELIEETSLLEPEDAPGHYDPHVWMDASAWALAVDAVREALADLLPEYADEFELSATAYRDALLSLHEYGKTSIATIPEKHRILITSHDAFNYFGRAYGIEVYGVQGISTESEAGLQRINMLVDLLVERKVPSVFVESSVPRKSVEALLRGAEARGHTVKIGGELFSDAMGPAGTYAGTYIGMIDHNITVVTRSLGGDAPPAGFNGSLSSDGAAGSSAEN